MADVSIINGYNIKDAGGRALIQNLDDRVTSLHAPYYVLVGDSYGYDAVRDGISVTGWTTLFKQWNGLTEGTDCFSRSEAGAGFSNTSSDGRNFNGILSYIAAGMTSEEKDLVGTIIIAGGTNDHNAANRNADYVTLFNTLKLNIDSNFPNCSKVLIAPIGMNNATRTSRLLAPELYSKYENACRYVGFSFAWGAWYYRYDHRTETSDYIHLNNDGEKIATSMICTALSGGKCGYYARETISVTPSSAYTTSTLEFELIIQDSTITLSKTETNHQFMLVTPGSFTMGSSQHTMGTTVSNVLPHNNYIVYRTSGRCHDADSGKFFDAPVMLWIVNGNFSITIPYTDDLTGYKTITNCDFVGIDLNDFAVSLITI